MLAGLLNPLVTVRRPLLLSTSCSFTLSLLLLLLFVSILPLPPPTSGASPSSTISHPPHPCWTGHPLSAYFRVLQLALRSLLGTTAFSGYRAPSRCQPRPYYYSERSNSSITITRAYQSALEHPGAWLTPRSCNLTLTLPVSALPYPRPSLHHRCPLHSVSQCFRSNRTTSFRACKPC